MKTNNVFSRYRTNSFTVRVEQRVYSTRSYIECWKMRHKIISKHETNKNVIKHPTFLTLKFYFFAYLSVLVVHPIHIFYDGLRKFWNVNVVLGCFIQRFVNRFDKLGRFSVQEYALGNVQMIQTKHN